MKQNLVSVSVSQLKANPFRELDDYPIDRIKVDKLKESIQSTGFWGTIVARKVGNNYEIAFGHHRKVALEELVAEGVIKKNEKVEIIVRELSNEEMLQLMARENLEEWGSDAYIEAQTVESTIRAYGKGEIELPELSKDTRKEVIRNVGPASGLRPYTKDSVAKFLGWVKDSTGKPNHACNVAFDMLDAFEAGIVTRKELRKVPRDIAREIVSKAMAIYKEQQRIAAERERQAEEAREAASRMEDARKRAAAERLAVRLTEQSEAASDTAKECAREFSKDAVENVKKGNWAQRDVRVQGAEAKDRLRSESERNYRTAREYYDSLRRMVVGVFDEQDNKFTSLVSFLEMDCGLEQDDIDSLRIEVEALQNRAVKFAKKLNNWKPRGADAVADSSTKQRRLVRS